MNIDDFLAKWFDEGSEEYIAAESDLRRILDSARATVLAEEERRVWCERYTNCYEWFGVEAALVAADRFLDRYREAQRAWEARGEEKG